MTEENINTMKRWIKYVYNSNQYIFKNGYLLKYYIFYENLIDFSPSDCTIIYTNDPSQMKINTSRRQKIE